MFCKWCKFQGKLYKGYCFDCHKMKVVENMGCAITFKEYDMLTQDTDILHCLSWVLNDTLYLFGNSTCFIN